MRTSLLSRGTYDMQVVDTEVIVTKHGQKDAVRAVLTFGGAHVMCYFVLYPDNSYGITMTYRNLKAFGVNPIWMTPQQVANELLGRSATVDVTVAEYQGREYNQVGHIRACHVMTRRELNLMDTA